MMVRYFSSQLAVGCAGRPSVRTAPHRLAMSSPTSLECRACTTPGMLSVNVHLPIEVTSRTTLLRHCALHASQLMSHCSMRRVRLERHISMESPDSAESRYRANLFSQ